MMDKLEEIKLRDVEHEGLTLIVHKDRRWLLAEVERLRAGLEWYGDLANYIDADPPDYNSRVAHDRGEKARRALAGEE